ncbi:probable beta-D-xylosidase 2 [Brachypodium distachyon]|uniref:probable beta-D-xylosidase 2 n=1 Tax=Brachypodium distachyon TaxID=15368 RepID=UPI000D0CE407|nr:probable beta-D-xylosidase 2 [Brachypodium distachyon]|eukprot:XP_024310913.1 probable beta-D-xylosidase 2 [Brachypodium distachyon]
MASSTHLAVLAILLLVPLSTARAVLPSSNDDDGGSAKTAAYTKVCDASRFAAAGLDMSRYRYCDAKLPYGDRVRDLIGWMTVEEKVSNLGDWAAGAPRVGLPPYKWWSEALHGLSSTGPTTKFDDLKKPRLHSGRAAVFNGTVFANVINSAASFNESLWRSIGQAISTEARAMYNLGKGGLTYWSPNINVVRDPRWGRALETPGEDPFVVGRYAVNFVRGMQDVDDAAAGFNGDPLSRPLKTSACCKHYAAYDVDDWYGHTRFKFDARVTERDMVETFQRPFEMCVRDGDASAVMCSYNRVNGIPACADARLLAGTLRRDWGLHGYIVSDCDAVRVMTDNATWLGYTPAEASAASLKAGLDLDCGESWIVQKGKPVMDFLSTYGMAAVRQGKMRESDIDNALVNLYTTLMRLGYFDGMPRYESLDEKDICSEAHRSLALDGARQSMVLLKNLDGLLPLDASKLASVAVRGPHAEAPEKVMDGDYTGPPCRYITPREGISKDVNISQQGGDVTIYMGGINMHIEREGNDREDLLLPKNQTEEILRVAAASPSPIVLVILSGGGIDVSFAQSHPKIGAILWAGYPGGEGGHAIADVIFGRYNPGGRLPLTWFKNKYIHQLPMTSMALRPRPEHGYPGRTYKFYDGPDVLYPFGYGLSYTKFRYELLNKETALAGAPIKQVAAFRRVAVKAGAAETVVFTLNVCKAFGIVEKTAYTVVPSGVSTVIVENGDSSAVSFPVQISFSA